MQAKHYLVSGKVQGVCYRKVTKLKADQLQLAGWVRNLDDGRVEAYAIGGLQQLQEFESFLYQGPPNARVTDVIIENRELKIYDGFEILE